MFSKILLKGLIILLTGGIGTSVVEVGLVRRAESDVTPFFS